MRWRARQQILTQRLLVLVWVGVVDRARHVARRELLRPFLHQNFERIGERRRVLVILLLLDEQLSEVQLLPDKLCCILDRRSDQSPPHFKSGLSFRAASHLELRVAQQDGVERSQDLGTMVLRPSGSGCWNGRFSGSTRSTSRRMWRLREARSPRGPILLPLKKWIVEAAV